MRQRETAMFDIESKIPIPAKGTGRGPIYPFHDMKVGDSFFVPDPPDGQRNRIYSSAYGQRRTSGGKVRYTCRLESGGVRVWRVE